MCTWNYVTPPFPDPSQRVVSVRSWPEWVRNLAQNLSRTDKFRPGTIDGKKLSETPKRTLPASGPAHYPASRKAITRSDHELAGTTRCISQPTQCLTSNRHSRQAQAKNPQSGGSTKSSTFGASGTTRSSSSRAASSRGRSVSRSARNWSTGWALAMRTAGGCRTRT